MNHWAFTVEVYSCYIWKHDLLSTAYELDVKLANTLNRGVKYFSNLLKYYLGGFLLYSSTI